MTPATLTESLNQPARSRPASETTDALRDRFQRPLHDLRISVIDRCNFRCTYCMPETEYSHNHNFLNKDKWLNFEEITRLTRLFAQLGVRKVRITGGEPLLRPNLHELIKRINGIEAVEDLALTTNATFLPEQADLLRQAGLKRLTVSLDTLDEKVFHQMNGSRGSVREVLEGVREAERQGFRSIKINAVIQKGVNDHTLLDLVRHFRGSGHIVRFIEYMDVGTCNNWRSEHVLPSAEIVKRIDEKFPLEPLEPNYHGEVAARYAYRDGKGEIGFISSVTQPFCGSCTRARLSTDGKLYTCLFAGEGTDLRAPLRNGAGDEELLKIISGIWKKREDRYSEERARLNAAHEKRKKIEMYQIGG